jgi:hypothetical protein
MPMPASAWDSIFTSVHEELHLTGFGHPEWLIKVEYVFP